ncbi:MAG TPA: 2-dehydropantoate 2-reductase [Sphingomicrobium sp.]
MAAARVAILGAGSVGCFIGGCWQAAGVPVTLIGRPRFAGDIAGHGLTVSDYSGWARTLSDADYRTDPSALGEADVIALCVKSGATQEAAGAIAEHGRDGALVISFQNGIRNFDVLSEVLGGRFELARGLVSYNVAYLGEGRFHKGVAGQLWAEDLPLTRGLAETVGETPGEIKLSRDMLGLAWGKLLINLNNAVNALSGRTLLEELRQRDYRRVVAASQREGLRLLDAAGIAPAKLGAAKPKLLPQLIDSPDWLFNRLFLKKWKIDARARSSMADDLAAGHRTEVDYINGELVALAERLGLDAPVNRRIVELIRAAEAGAPPMAPAELRRAVFSA